MTYVEWFLPNDVGLRKTAVSDEQLPTFLRLVIEMGATVLEVR